MLRLTWVGHSTVLLDLDGVRLLTDPVLRPRLAHLRRVGAPADPEELGGLEAALVSHLHHDHLDLPSLDLLGHALRVVVPRGGGGLLRSRGFGRATELDVGEELPLGEVTVRATPAEHHVRRGVFGVGTPAVGYLVSGSARVYFAGDTDLFDGMAELASDLDVALLPVAGWGPRLPPGHLDPLRAAQALALLRPRIAVPIHWGTYRPIGFAQQEAPLRAPADAFAGHAAELAPEVEVHIVPVGGSLELSASVPERAVP